MSKDAFWDQGVDVVIHRGVLTEEAYTRRAATFGCYPKLDHHLLALAGCSQEEFLFLVSLLYCTHSTSLVDPHLRHLGDLQAACIVDERVFYVNKQVGHFTGKEEALLHCHFHVGNLWTNKANFCLKGDNEVKSGIVYDWAHR